MQIEFFRVKLNKKKLFFPGYNVYILCILGL